jgi:hypothetical protein
MIRKKKVQSLRNRLYMVKKYRRCSNGDRKLAEDARELKE